MPVHIDSDSCNFSGEGILYEEYCVLLWRKTDDHIFPFDDEKKKNQKASWHPPKKLISCPVIFGCLNCPIIFSTFYVKLFCGNSGKSIECNSCC